jgi:RHS repeat-associated protein
LGERRFKPGTVFAYDEARHQIGEYTAGVSQGQEVLWLGDLPIAMIQARAGEQALDSPARRGAWQFASQPAGASLGSFYRNDPGTGAATKQWAIPQTIAGRSRWVEAPTQTAAARYSVIHAGGSSQISVDQRQNGGRWKLLGTFNFASGANHRAVLTNAPDGAVIADAIKLVSDNLAARIGNIHTDHLGTPRLIEDHSGKTVWRWDHLDPFGANPANEDPDGDGVKVVFNLRFPGQVFDKETGTHYNYFRDYDPSTGRYVQSDPFGLDGGTNAYSYVSGNPLSLADPDGLDPWGADRGLRFKMQGPNVPYPSTIKPELFVFMHCVQTCYPDPVTITATTNGHTTGAHASGNALDFTLPSGSAGANQAMCCVLQCKAKYAQDEYHYPSPNATGGHIHAQLRPGKGGATGTGRKPKPKCNSCSSSGGCDDCQ